MLQIDHVYEFLYHELFKEFEVHHCSGGVVKTSDVSSDDIVIFKPNTLTLYKIFFYDQEPFIPSIAQPYLNKFDWVKNHEMHDLIARSPLREDEKLLDIVKSNPQYLYNPAAVAVSEISNDVDVVLAQNKFYKLYYFFHGFAALDWYRGYYALNFSKNPIRQYSHDFISYNRLILDDRSYRIYFISLLKATGLLNQGLVSFNVSGAGYRWQDETTNINTKLSETAKQHIEQNLIDVDKLVIDSHNIPGSASADMYRGSNHIEVPRLEGFWNVVTETVFYYNKLHLTEKIFKPIVSKQPFMLLAAPGNLEYLRSYGFKTFDGIIDESYDKIIDNDQRVNAVVEQLQWYCNLSADKKQQIIERISPIVEYNFQHFYGEFKHIITKELLENTKTLFKEMGYSDNNLNYKNIHHLMS